MTFDLFGNNTDTPNTWTMDTHAFLNKTILVTVVLLSASPTARAQDADGPVQPNDNILHLSAGTGGPWLIKFDQTSASPLFQMNYERVLADVPGTGMVGIGAHFGFKSLQRESSLGTGSYFYYDTRYTVIPVGMRITTHYWLGMDKLDTYGGVGGGINLVSMRVKEEAAGGDLFTEDQAVKSYFHYSLFVGARYAITENVGAFAELAYGNSYLNFGAALKF
jgi:opacity protein-like surface antigen